MSWSHIHWLDMTLRGAKHHPKLGPRVFPSCSRRRECQGLTLRLDLTMTQFRIPEYGRLLSWKQKHKQEVVNTVGENYPCQARRNNLQVYSPDMERFKFPRSPSKNE
jgi:hypothetical protein